MRRPLNILIAAVLLLSLPLATQAEETTAPAQAVKVAKERLVLMPLRVGEEDQILQGAMETALVQGLQEKYEVFSGEQVAQKAKEIFRKESKSTAKKDCDETRCMQDIAEAFQAELISTANVTKRADGYFLALSIQNIFDNKVVYSNSVPCKNCDAYQVIDKLKELSGGFKSTQKADTSFRDCPDCPEMALIPAGSFEMGSLEGGKSEMPLHKVTFAKAFGISKTEITQGQWKAIMGDNPSEFKECGNNCPVEKISWEDAQAYVKKLAAKTGKQYRLPSEAEWEYACRGGVRQDYCGGDNINEVAWVGDEPKTPASLKSTKPVATKQANGFGLYDMSGNVWEWTQDSAHKDYKEAPTDGSAWKGSDDRRMLRGGSWYHSAEFARTTTRGSFVADSRNGSFGLRVAVSLK